MSASVNYYDVIVCGAGHAGIEAAAAAARMGGKVLLLTGNLDTIGQMSCNPAIGGQAKGQIVREIDAMGGLMAVNTDTTAIQFRLLNESKGMAVQSPRAQCDKKAYQYRVKHTLEHTPGLDLFQATVIRLMYEQPTPLGHRRVCGVETDLGVSFRGKTVVVTTGTFLRGLMHVGPNKNEGGRMGDFAAKHLSASLQGGGIELHRLKTGTPPRILGRSISFHELIEQPGDKSPTLFGFYDTRLPEDLFHVEQYDETKLGWHAGQSQVSCWITYTTPSTAEIVRSNLHLSAMYSGEIKGVGPRYCPSIEDKFVRFADKERHILFLEPEGRSTNEYYINGLSTSLPLEIQIALVHSIPGLENAHILRPAYAVEYDFAPPTQLSRNLESRIVENLFFAGQINGTSGYEEAACQGLLAGANAILKGRGEPPWIIGRNEGYTGVLIDDLVTKGTQEPYRMFTSRAEHRLLFNHGSAELRLSPRAAQLGLIPPDRWSRIESKAQAIDHWVRWLSSTAYQGKTWADAIRRGVGEDVLPIEFHSQSQAIRDEVLYRVRYAGYLERETRMAQKLYSLEKIQLSSDIKYMDIKGLRIECAVKLDALKPTTLAQASRVSGVTPADVQILWIAAHACATPHAPETGHEQR